MSISITERILSSNKFYTDKYLKDTINLTKSITLKNNKEATLYNEYIVNIYPSHFIDNSDKRTWRYYKHLSGEVYSLDVPMVVISIDNGESIELSPQSLSFHKLTHKELLKFDLFYKEIVDKYPDQELYLKTIINNSVKYTIQEIIDLEDFSIVSYNYSLIEENEHDLMYHLQNRIDNYKNTKLIQHYALTDSLFIASQYHILYNFIFTTLIALRLQNAKTLRAHSYHILNYLSSHHYLDIHHFALTKKQALYLYRNLLYLNNHSGRDLIFRTLIDKLFTDRNITVVNYTYSQSNTIDDNNYTEYKFKQKLLNNANFVYSYLDYDLQDVLNKELPLVEGNPKQIKYHYDEIDTSYKNSLYSTLLTKDIETIIVDNTDTVKHKLIETLIDYWGYLLKTNNIKFLVSLQDPVSNKQLRLNTKDLFKLFIIVLFKLNKIDLVEFPDYFIKRVYKPTLPTREELQSYFYRKHYYHKPMIDEILRAVPKYATTITSYQFEQFVTSIYRLNIGLWLFTTNQHDKDDEGQFSNLIENLHHKDIYSFNDETVTVFLKRVALEGLLDYPTEALQEMSFSILNNMYDNKLSFLNKYKFIQKSLIEVFKKFNSYTVQLVDNYSNEPAILAGHKETRVTILEDKHKYEFFYYTFILNLEMYYKTKDFEEIPFKQTYLHKNILDITSEVPITSNINIESGKHTVVDVLFTNKIINELGDNNWIATESSEEDAMFLALNS